jgi:preprotein translocase subunit SecA
MMRRLSQGSRDSALSVYEEQVAAVNAVEPELRRATDKQLDQRAKDLKRRVQSGQSPGTLTVELFALVRELARRQVAMRPFDVQLIGGLGLYEGKVVQMATGEGKTLAAVAPVTLHALSGLGVHVLTFNDYLARRDAEWMGPIYRSLGLTVGHIQEGMSRAERRAAYRKDVTYLTAKEAGFDFLRDGLAYDMEDLVQRPFQAAVVDEADSILIDEARVPLVIAGTMGKEPGQQQLMRSVVQQLQPGQHYAVDEHGRNAYLTEEGSERAEILLDCDDLYAPANLQMLTELNLALHVEALMRRDVDYIVRDGRIEIVDDFTGRVVKDRHWPHGEFGGRPRSGLHYIATLPGQLSPFERHDRYGQTRGR